MSTDAVLTVVVIVAMILALVTELMSPAVVMVVAVFALVVFGVIDEQTALSGFSNPAPATIAALYVLAGAAEVTGALEGITNRFFGGAKRTEQRDLVRLLVPSAGLSGIVPNTPIVSLLAPRITQWCSRSGRSASRYLLPVSYAVVLGGVISVMGTSTNITINGLLQAAGDKPFSLFEFTPVGLCVAIAGVALLILICPRLLPDRSSPVEDAASTAREFTVEMVVSPASPLAGRTVQAAGLRHLDGVFLVAIERDGASIETGPDTDLVLGDRLIFAGDVNRLLDLQAIPGLASAEERHFATVAASRGQQLYEVVVSPESELVGSTLPEIDFRSRYGAAVVAVHRSGERLEEKPGQVRFRPGDVLLVLGDEAFGGRWRDHSEFTMLVGSSAPVPPRRSRARFVELVLLAVIVSAAATWTSLLMASMLGALLLLLTRTITPGEARRAINTDILIIMAASIPLGTAVATSGLAQDIADAMVHSLDGFGSRGVLLGVLVATMILTEPLSNNGAAALMFPVALAAAQAASLNSRPLVLAVLLGASCSFLTPIGYQTNTLVWGLGGYKFSDFTKVGVPLTLMTVVVTIAVLPVFFPL